MSASADSRLKALIASCGPIPVGAYMQYCLHHRAHGYYAKGAGIGSDFTTAPEISQVFGELIGLWSAHEWNALGCPEPWYWVELGPGRGTMAADAMRAMAVAPDCTASMRMVMVEGSAALRETQKKTLAATDDNILWVGSLEEIPQGPAIVVANEFLDCLPVRRLVRDGDIWREQMVGLDRDGCLTFGLGSVAPSPSGPAGDIVDNSPATLGVASDLAGRLDSHPGRALLIDYGYGPGETPADTFRAFRDGKRCHPLRAADGKCDLTADVDFGAIAATARAAGACVDGPITQRDFLTRLSIRERGERLMRSAPPERISDIAGGIARLIDASGMGKAFRVMTLSSPGLGPPAGFQVQ